MKLLEPWPKGSDFGHLHYRKKTANNACNPCQKYQTPPDLVVDHWTSDVESSSPLDFRLLHAMWTPFGCLMSYEIRPIISVACDFTTKSGGIWGALLELLLTE